MTDSRFTGLCLFVLLPLAIFVAVVGGAIIEIVTR